MATFNYTLFLYVLYLFVHLVVSVCVSLVLSFLLTYEQPRKTDSAHCELHLDMQRLHPFPHPHTKHTVDTHTQGQAKLQTTSVLICIPHTLPRHTLTYHDTCHSFPPAVSLTHVHSYNRSTPFIGPPHKRCSASFPSWLLLPFSRLPCLLRPPKGNFPSANTAVSAKMQGRPRASRFAPMTVSPSRHECRWLQAV